MSDFIVRIDATKLTAKQQAAIAAAIQGAVLAELGDLDLAHGGDSTKAAAGPVGLGSVIFHPEWRGMWIRNIKEFQAPQQQVLTVQAR